MNFKKRTNAIRHDLPDSPDISVTIARLEVTRVGQKLLVVQDEGATKCRGRELQRGPGRW
jgi:hypothetical protein